jgi:hypothetical protein
VEPPLTKYYSLLDQPHSYGAGAHSLLSRRGTRGGSINNSSSNPRRAVGTDDHAVHDASQSQSSGRVTFAEVVSNAQEAATGRPLPPSSRKARVQQLLRQRVQQQQQQPSDIDAAESEA